MSEFQTAAIQPTPLIAIHDRRPSGGKPSKREPRANRAPAAEHELPDDGASEVPEPQAHGAIDVLA